MVRKIKFYIGTIGVVFVLLLGSTAFAEPVFPSHDELMMSQMSCVQSAPHADVQLMSAENETQKIDEPKKLLTILIEFEDIEIKFDGESWYKQMYSTEPKDLSVVNYWKENANGLDVFEPYDTSCVTDGRKGKVSYEDYIDIGYTVTKCPKGIVKVKLDIPHPFAVWDENDSTTENKIVSLVIRAIEKDFDFNVNIKPHIITIFAGYESLSSTTEGKGQMHAHTNISGVSTSTGINLGKFAVQGELQEFCVGEEYGYIMQGIGTTCHELGHSVFNLPDLYFSSEPPGLSNGICNYSLMSTGCWGCRYDPADYNGENDYGDPYAKYRDHVPSHLDPWCKIKCGFVTPTLVTDWEGNINSISDTGNTYNVIKVQSKADPKQYFLIENRQLIGFDKGLETLNSWADYPYDNLFDGGILIYHIDENIKCESNNNTSKHRFISIERSGKGADSDNEPIIWTYLNINARNKFSAATEPNSNFYEADNLKICSRSKECHPQTVESGISIEILDESSPSMRVRVNVDDEYKIAETGETFSDIFPDINFCNTIIEILSEDGKERNASDIISAEDWIKLLSIETLYISDRNIKSLQGIEFFSKLMDIDCSNNELTKLDFSNNPELNYIDCKNNKLTEINVSACKNLMILYCNNNSLKKLDIRNNTELLQLNCLNNELTELDVSGNHKLDRLICYNNYMAEDYRLGISGLDNLKESLVSSENNNFKYSPQKTAEVTPSPSPTPTVEPSPTPTASPTPTVEPTASPAPTLNPSPTPTAEPSPTPTASPTPTPTPSPTPTSTAEPTPTPTPEQVIECVKITAEYSDGILKSVKTENVRAKLSEIINAENTRERKVFYWKSFESMEPVTAEQKVK